MKITLLCFVMTLLTAGHLNAADETLKEKTRETASDVKRESKDTVRKVEDKTCELVNGKMQCTAKKVKHSIERGADKLEDAAD